MLIMMIAAALAGGAPAKPEAHIHKCPEQAKCGAPSTKPAPDMDEFASMDLDGDGAVTRDEFARHRKVRAATKG